MANVLLICASPRPESNSAKAAKYLQGLITAQGHTVESRTFLGIQIRSIGEGYIQPNELTPQQKQIIDGFNTAEYVIWVVPEYNRNLPAEMIAFVEHFGAREYPHIWNDKIHAIVGVSSGIGGRDAAYTLAKMFNYMIDNVSGHNCFVSPFMYQSINTGGQFDATGNFTGDPRYADNAEKFITKLLGEAVS